MTTLLEWIWNEIKDVLFDWDSEIKQDLLKIKENFPCDENSFISYEYN